MIRLGRLSLAVAAVVYFSGVSLTDLGWVSGPRPWSSAPIRLRSQRTCLSARSELEDDIIILPADSESVSLDEILEGGPVIESGAVVRKPTRFEGLGGEDGFRANTKTPPKPKRTPGGDGSRISEKLEATAAAAGAGALALATKKGADAVAPKKTGGFGKKRWLAGRGSAKRRKLEENNRLIEWLVENGVWVSEKADWGRSPAGISIAVETRELTENEVSGRGVVAARAINHYEELARVPVNIVMTKAAAAKKFGGDMVNSQFGDFIWIALHLMYEKFVEGDKSFWKPYMDILPTTNDIAASFTWEDKEIEELLVGSPLRNTSLFFKSRIREEYKLLNRTVFKDNSDLFPTDIFTYERFVWAYSILFSRAVRLDFGEGDVIALVPYLDLMNHSPFADTYIYAKEDGLDIPFEKKDQFIVVEADKYYDQYDQIYISYGPKSNADLLLLYGFCLDRNMNDHIEISVQTWLDDDPYKKVKLQIAKEFNINMDTTTLYRDRWPVELMQCLRLTVYSPTDLGLEEEAEDEKFYNALSLVDWGQPYGENTERGALEFLKAICNYMMDAYTRTLDEDEKLINDRKIFEMLPKKQRMAARLMFHEKSILRATTTTVDRIMNNLAEITKMQEREKKKKEDADKTMLGRLGLKWDPAYSATNFEEFLKELEI